MFSGRQQKFIFFFIFRLYGTNENYFIYSNRCPSINCYVDKAINTYFRELTFNNDFCNLYISNVEQAVSTIM